MENVFRPAARIIVLNEKDEVLIVKVKEVWALPGGGIDFGENMKVALERESVEELGIKAIADKMIFIQDYTCIRKGNLTHFFEYFWIIKNNDDYKNVIETYKNSSHAFELSEIKFCKVEDLPETFMPKAFPKVIKRYLENKKSFSCEYIAGTGI